MFTIKVVETSTGRPVKGARVCVGFKGLLGGAGIMLALWLLYIILARLF